MMPLRGLSPLGAGRGGAAESWWLSGGIASANCVAAYAAKGAAALAASYVNLANPGTYDAAPGVAPTWDVTNGWKFAGASLQYLTTGIIPTTLYSLVIRFSGCSTSGAYLAGSYKLSPVTLFAILPTYTSTGVNYWNGTVPHPSTPSVSSGVLGFAGSNAYRNGISDGTISSLVNTNLAMYIGALNAGGSPGLYLTGNIQAVAIYNTTITAPQVLAVSTAMALL